MENESWVLQQVPHVAPYRFVNEILKVDEQRITGNCHLPEDSFFYKGHFPSRPITPGFIVTEIMAQIGVLCLGLFLVRDRLESISHAYITSADVKFHNISYPNDTITVTAEKILFRFNLLKVNAEARNDRGDLICSGILTGMVQ